ncbi:MAG: class I SAM-dependent methyltransferase [Candidatus Muirbacterium halophilum]|nr:class I SAM-dependent methyltransferase [Candidatus Muirbacterium halophilum]MCK9474637.1 class I SAM-dependent methyltransferase [Candidatus Muirbacterium halophilum]
MNSNYYSSIRNDIIKYIPKKVKNILEIGAGTGNTLLKIKELDLAENVYGIEILKIENSNQTNPIIKEFIIGDIEKLNLNFENNFFDIIIAGDVLEHLVNPWKTISYLSKFLKKDGLIISSIPNIRNYKVLKDIFFKGSFTYQESGILDKTHLRFFCKKNIIDLFKKSNFSIIKIESNRTKSQYKFRLKNILSWITFGYLNNFFIKQYFVIAKKND